MGSKRQNFGEWLDITLSNKRMRGRDLAEAVGVHDSAVSRWRSGSGVPAMEALTQIAETLGVDSLRLAVTAGLVPARVAGVGPLAIPKPTAQRESVRRQIANIKGLDSSTRQLLLTTYEERINGE